MKLITRNIIKPIYVKYYKYIDNNITYYGI